MRCCSTVLYLALELAEHWPWRVLGTSRSRAAVAHFVPQVSLAAGLVAPVVCYRLRADGLSSRRKMEALRCTFGPRLRSSNMCQPEPAYVPPKWERWGDNLVLGTSSLAWALLTSLPILLLLVLRLLWQLRWRDETYLSILGIVHTSALSRLVYFLGFLRISGQLMRGFGRMKSAEYIRWHRMYRSAASGRDDAPRQLLESDWEPRAVDFTARAPGRPRTSLPPAAVSIPPGWQGLALRVPGVSKQIAKTLARRLIYPGSVFFLQQQMQPMLLQGRGQLIRQQCQRFCVKSRNGNTIDCMLCDRRGRSSVGERLFITSEGNASFYGGFRDTSCLPSCVPSVLTL